MREIVAVCDVFRHRGCSLRFMNENPETDASNTEEQELSEEFLDDVGGGMNGLDTNMGLLSNRLTSLTRDGVPREDGSSC